MNFVFVRHTVSAVTIWGFLIIGSIATGAEDAKTVYLVHVDGKRGFINRNRQMVIQPTFDDAHHFSDGVAFVKVGGKWGLIDTSGNYRVEPRFDDCRNCFEGLCSVKLGDKWGYISSTTGKVVVPLQFEVARGFEEAAQTPKGKLILARAKYQGKWEFIDQKGKAYIAPSVLEGLKLEDLQAMEDGRAPVKVGGKWGYIDQTGKMVIKPQFNEAGAFIGDYAGVQREPQGKYGYINKKEKVVIPYEFDEVGEFEDGTMPPHGLAPAKLGGKWGYIDRKGKVVIQPQFDAARQFENGLAEVRVGDAFGYVDHNGKYVWKPSK